MAATVGAYLLGQAVATYGTTAFFVQYAVGYLATSALTSVALYALMPKPDTPEPSSNSANRGYQISTRAAAANHQIIYGQTKVGGAVVYDDVSGVNNKVLHRVIAFTGHEIEEFTTFYFNNEALTLTTDTDGNGDTYYKPTQATGPSGAVHTRYNDFTRIYFRKGGSENNTAIANLISEGDGWTQDHKLQGVAYAYIRLAFDSDSFPNGVPEMSCLIKGKKVYDPRTSTTAWSSNPALCIRDYLTNSSYGLGEASTSIDDTQIIIAADVCDYKNYDVNDADPASTKTGGTRFSLNGSFTTAVTPYSQLMEMLGSMGGMLWYGQGSWRMRAAHYVAPTLTFTEDDLRSAINISTRHSRRDNFNTVKGVFRGPATNYQPTDYAEVTNNAFRVADNNQISIYDLNLPYTQDFDIARRVALITLERNRQQLTVQAEFGMRAFQAQVGDIVRLTNARLGFSNKEFEVMQWSFGLKGDNDLTVSLTLREISESVFDDISDGQIYERDNTNLLSPFEVPPVAIAAANQYGGEFKVVSEKLLRELQLDVTAADPSRIDRVEVQYRPTPEEFTFDDLQTQANLTADGQWKLSTASTPAPTIWGQSGWTTGTRTVMAYVSNSDTAAKIDAIASGDYITFTSSQISGNVTAIIDSTFVSAISNIVYFYLVQNSVTLNGTTGPLSEDPNNTVTFTHTIGGPTADYLNIGTGGLGRYSVLDLDEGNYDARVRGINTFGVKGEYSYLLNFLLQPLDSPPADVDSNTFTFEVSQGTIFLQWSAISDLDLSYYQIKYSSDLTTASVSDGNTLWGGNSNILVQRVGRPATNISVPARSGTYLIKAYDKAGNESDNVGYVVVPASALPVLGNIITQTEHSAFVGNTGISNSNIQVDTAPSPDELRINDTSGATPAGIYYYGGALSGAQTASSADYIDVGTVRTVTTSGSVTFARHIDYSSVFDNIPQNWDTWPDTFDDWTNEDAGFGDFSTAIQVRATNDDPASSPTWGAWADALGQQVVGRGFQFRVKLDATNTEVSPKITELTGTIGY